MPEILRSVLWVSLGGALGSVLRYAAGFWRPGEPFPWPTLLVNVGGCLLIGWLYGLSLRHHWLAGEGRLLLMTGFCGGLTTFSAFSLENFRLLQAGDYRTLTLYLLLSLLLSVGAVAAGYNLAK